VAVKIVTQHICPPIPSFKFDWRATWDGYDLGDPVGYGATEQEAIDDLREILGLDANNEPDPAARGSRGK
jgi:hypothetical protein